MKQLISVLLLINLLLGCSVETVEVVGGDSNYFYIHGQKHIFKVYAPNNWVNDFEHANALGIGSFFKPNYSVTETPKTSDLYIYAQGWDKANQEASLERFIRNDQEDIRQRFNGVKISKRDFQFENNSHINKVAYFTIENIPGRYKEDCVFVDTNTTIVNIVYSGINQEIYDKHREEFNEFLSKFVFLSSDPDEIREILEKDKKERPWIKEFVLDKK